MRSLRLFYGDKECTRGQVVIASRESQYKILHFHHSGLDKLAAIFEEWNLFANAREKVFILRIINFILIIILAENIPKYILKSCKLTIK